MKTNLGEEGTEQFTIETRVDGKLIATQRIHDPFVHSTVSHKLGRWEHFKQVFAPKTIKVQVAVNGTTGVMRAIMALDPEKMQADTDEWLIQQAKRREESGVMGYYAEKSA